jgi:hypothetical protein
MHEGSGSAASAKEIHDEIERLGVQDRGRLKIFSGGGGSGENENAGADDGADAEGGQRPGTEGFAEPVLGIVGFGDELVDGFTTKSLGVRGADDADGWLTR